VCSYGALLFGWHCNVLIEIVLIAFEQISDDNYKKQNYEMTVIKNFLSSRQLRKHLNTFWYSGTKNNNVVCCISILPQVTSLTDKILNLGILYFFGSIHSQFQLVPLLTTYRCDHRAIYRLPEWSRHVELCNSRVRLLLKAIESVSSRALSPTDQ